MNKVKKVLSRVLCGASALVMLFVAVANNMANVKADTVRRSTNSYNNSLSHQIVARTLKQCVENYKRTGYADNLRPWEDKNIIATNITVNNGVHNGDIFNNTFDFDSLNKDVNVGGFLKQNVLGEGIGDGRLECSSSDSSIVRVFAETFSDVLGTNDVGAVLCGENGTSGLVTAVEKHLIIDKYPVNGCGDPSYKYKLNDNALDYLKSIYDKWLETSEDASEAVGWDELDKADFSDKELNYLVYNDLVASCGVSGIDNGGATQITYVDENNKAHTMYMNSASANQTSLYVAYIDEPVSCSELAEMLNDFAEEFKDTVEEDQGKICYDDWQKKISNITDQNTIDEYKGFREQATRNNDYSVFYDSKNDKCVDIGNTEGSEIEEVKTLQDVGATYQEAAKAVGEEDERACFDHGVGALGWIICPIIKLLRQTTKDLYDNVITPFLEIDAQAFKTDGAAFTAWRMFQSVANILFVIFLLIIIFSQITGVGIDNYGIKRMLPKLIVGAVLVNLSFFICQLLVDISNIIGYAIENLFETWASNALAETGATTVGQGKAIGATIISGAVGIGGIAAAIGTASIWLPVTIVPLMLSLISIIMSCLFAFVALGVRQAAAVILVVISPLAFVAYMLPNTKKLFDRWLSAFKIVLLLFPICGLLMGGGAFAGAILWNVSSTGADGGYFLGQLLAALMTVVPFFFIPKLLKSSLSAIGNIGATISNLGNTLGRGAGAVAKGAVGNSNWFKDMQSRRGDILNAKDRQRERRRLEGVISRTNGPGLSTEQKLQRARALTAIEKMNDEDDLASRPELITSEAASKRFQRRVAAQRSALVANGTTGRIGDVKADKFAGGESFQEGTLAYALYNAQSDEDRYAAVSELMAGGHHGEQALHQVMQALGQDNDTAALQSIAAAAKADKNFAGLKGASRSDYDYINDIANGGNPGTVDSTIGNVNFGNMSQQGLVGTNVEELDRYLNALQTGQLSGAQAEKLQQLASDALANERLTAQTKGKVGDVLGQIASYGNYGSHGGSGGGSSRSPQSGDSSVLNVPRANAGTTNPIKVPESSTELLDNLHQEARRNNTRSAGTRMPNASQIDSNQSGQDQFLDYNDGRGR